ncbi:MAG: hypothetical protein F7C34_01070 [Desulfurococcales archaeon]|nr:hypothetical protein [Desulfurococcales archaeon]
MAKSRNRVVGVALLVVGLILGVVYPAVLIWLDEERALRVILYTFIAVSILIGAFIGAVGLVLLRGFRPSGAEDTG